MKWLKKSLFSSWLEIQFGLHWISVEISLKLKSIFQRRRNDCWFNFCYFFVVECLEKENRADDSLKRTQRDISIFICSIHLTVHNKHVKTYLNISWPQFNVYEAKQTYNWANNDENKIRRRRSRRNDDNEKRSERNCLIEFILNSRRLIWINLIALLKTNAFNNALFALSFRIDDHFSRLWLSILCQSMGKIAICSRPQRWIRYLSNSKEVHFVIDT